NTMKQEPARTFDQTVVSAWQDELKAINNSNFKQQCLQRESELLPRFVEHYQQLKVLRRRVRRGLQR
ncbi:MAG TPA: hypothetical protein VKB53_04375, partial [Gammaproteobacteria bacterium]|nr:hypothetical protein [Gammaproteobacteria bacterium]